jgi:hypothetical protein
MGILGQRAELADEARHLLDRAGAGIDIGGRNFAAKRCRVAEDVKMR